jgi:TetR/AcrR family transcriptional repressor of nem operon
MNQVISRHTQTDTRKLILRKARDLLLTRSYLGLSFQELADRVGIRKASLYHHFASKEVLGIELMADSRARFVQWAAGIGHLPAAEQLLTYIRMFRDLIGAGEKVCPIGATGGEWDCIEPALQVAVRQFHQTQLDWLASVAAQLPDRLMLMTASEQALSADQWAAQLSAVCQGALINARLHADVGMFDMSVAPIKSLLSAQKL